MSAVGRAARPWATVAPQLAGRWFCLTRPIRQASSEIVNPALPVREAGAYLGQSFEHVRRPCPGWLDHSTVTDLARLRGWSTSVPKTSAVWYARSCNGNAKTSGATSVGMS